MAGSLKEKTFSKAKTQNPKISKTRWLPSDPNELCDRRKMLLQEKQAAIISNKITYEIFAFADKLIVTKVYLWNNIQRWLDCLAKKMLTHLKFLNNSFSGQLNI